MAELEDLEKIMLAPLDINTAVVDRAGRPTPTFQRHQQSFTKVIQASGKGAAAAIRQEGEVRAEADNASALLVDAVTAEALGFTAAILMKAEVGINPSGVLVRYQIVASLDPGGGLVQTGMYFDIVEDLLNPGEYLGEIHFDADKIKMGRADQAGSFPFRIEAGVVYIENAVIKNLSLGTEKVSPRGITDTTLGVQVGEAFPDDPYFITQGVPVDDDENLTGVLIDFTGFMARPDVDSGNFGNWRIRLYRNGVQINETPNQYYDDNFAYPVVAKWFDDAPGVDPVYLINGSIISGPADFKVSGGLAIFTLLKR